MDGHECGQGMLEGIAGVEARAYELLARMGASRLTKVPLYVFCGHCSGLRVR
jgi:hypothetical protein